MNPSVTVCIPVYNGASFIESAVRSVLAQTYQNFELIILNNASTDTTLAKINAIAQETHDSRIRIISHPTNIGAEANWNACLDEAKGQLLKILCADDLLYPTSLEKQVAPFVNDPEGQIALVASKRDIITSTDKVIFHSRGLGPLKKGYCSGSKAIGQIITSGSNLLGEPHAVLFRTSVIPKVGHFSSKLPYLIDLDYWIRILEVGGAYLIPEALSAFRVSEQSWSHSLVKAQSEQLCKFLEEVWLRHTMDSSYRNYWMGTIRAKLDARMRKLVYHFLSWQKHLSFSKGKS